MWDGCSISCQHFPNINKTCLVKLIVNFLIDEDWSEDCLKVNWDLFRFSHTGKIQDVLKKNFGTTACNSSTRWRTWRFVDNLQLCSCSRMSVSILQLRCNSNAIYYFWVLTHSQFLTRYKKNRPLAEKLCTWKRIDWEIMLCEIRSFVVCFCKQRTVVTRHDWQWFGCNVDLTVMLTTDVISWLSWAHGWKIGDSLI